MNRRMSFEVLFVHCVLAATVASTAVAGTIYVDARATGASDGSSWADAYTYLQDALAGADSGEKPIEIRVAQGTYRPDLGGGRTLHDQEATFQLVDGITLRGGFAGPGEPNPNARDAGRYETVLSGDLMGDDALVANPADLPDNPTRADNSYRVVTADMTDVTAVLDGFTVTGGSRHGMHNKSGSPTIANCTFRGNCADQWGGGLCNENGSPRLTRCTFEQNFAHYGGGIWNLKGTPVLALCVFNGNSATYGGGMYNYENSHPRIDNCVFEGNSAAYGAGLYSNKNCRPTITNCTFAENLANANGGAMRNVSDSAPVLTNCILSGDVPDEIVDYVMSGSSVRYCHVRGGMDKPWFGEGCIDGDPLFVGGDNLRLSPDSPCIDAGNNAAVPSEITTDIDNKPRIINGIVDMGAFEAGAI